MFISEIFQNYWCRTKNNEIFKFRMHFLHSAKNSRKNNLVALFGIDIY